MGPWHDTGGSGGCASSGSAAIRVASQSVVNMSSPASLAEGRMRSCGFDGSAGASAPPVLRTPRGTLTTTASASNAPSSAGGGGGGGAVATADGGGAALRKPTRTPPPDRRLTLVTSWP